MHKNEDLEMAKKQSEESKIEARFDAPVANAKQEIEIIRRFFSEGGTVVEVNDEAGEVLVEVIEGQPGLWIPNDTLKAKDPASGPNPGLLEIVLETS